MDPASTASVAFGATTLFAAGIAFALFVTVVLLALRLRALRARASALSDENDRLRPYADVADAAEEAARLRQQATDEARRVEQAAEIL